MLLLLLLFKNLFDFYNSVDNEEDNEDDEVEVSKKELDDLVSELLEGIGGDYNFDESSFGFNTDIVPLLGPNSDLTPICVPTDAAQNNVDISPVKILDIDKWRVSSIYFYYIICS